MKPTQENTKLLIQQAIDYTNLYLHDRDKLAPDNLTSANSLAMVNLYVKIEELIKDEFGINASVEIKAVTDIHDLTCHIWHSIPRKVIVTDLDNTMWSGVAGVDGEELVPNIPYQEWLLSLKEKGVILTIASKNNEADSLGVLNQAPGMLLRETDFVTWRINWNDKAYNIQSIADELNLGLQSFVFIDDDAYNLLEVTYISPEVLCLHPDRSANLRCFDYSPTDEDLKRTEMYQTERLREKLLTKKDWKRQLGITIAIHPLCPNSEQKVFDRCLQLINKVNQMNFITRRLSIDELEEFVRDSNYQSWYISATDKYGDYGIIGFMSGSFEGSGQYNVNDFLISCRALGRGVEETMIYFLDDFAIQRGRTVSYKIHHTDKNEPARNLFGRIGEIKAYPDYVTVVTYYR